MFYNYGENHRGELRRCSQHDDSDVISSYQIYARHDVGQAVINISYCDITFLTRWLYCVECPQNSTRLEALAYLYVSSSTMSPALRPTSEQVAF